MAEADKTQPADDEPMWSQPPSANLPRGSHEPEPAAEPVAAPAPESSEEAAEPTAELPEPDVAPSQPAAMPVRTFRQQAAVCERCGGEIGFDGYCEQCGAKAPDPRERWIEEPSAWVGAVCDRGQKHSRNEDAMATWSAPVPGSTAILVVCDGVSNSTDSDVASLAASRAAMETYRGRLSDWETMSGAEETLDALGQLAADAAQAANQAVLANSDLTSPSPASCTYAAAVISQGVTLVSSVGDSRVYWVPVAGPARQLTVDDSMAAEQMSWGMSREEAETSSQAHVITRWLGRDAPEVQPHVTLLEATPDAGWVVACTDGLWNYASDAEAFASIVRQAAKSDPAPLAMADELVRWANKMGGSDNITVAVAHLDAAPDELDAPTTRLRPSTQAPDEQTSEDREPVVPDGEPAEAPSAPQADLPAAPEPGAADAPNDER